MTATYDPNLSTDRDYVRFLVGDTDTATDVVQLHDEEIDALIAEQTATGEAVKYFAAAEALAVLRTRWASAGKGVVEKQVASLRIRRGVDTTADDAVTSRIRELRSRGAWLLSPSPKVFRVL